MADLTGGLLQADQRAAGDGRSAGQWMRDAQAQQAGGAPVFGGMLNPGGQAAPPQAPAAARLPHAGSMPSAQLAALVQAAGHTPEAIDQKLAQTDAMVHSLGFLSRKPNLTTADVREAATTAIARGHVTSRDATAFLASLPTDANPQQLRSAIQNRFADALLASVHLAGAKRAAMGAPS